MSQENTEHLKELAEFSALFISCKKYKGKLQNILSLKPIQFANYALFDILEKYKQEDFKNNIKLFAERYHISEHAVIETYFMGYILKYILVDAKVNFNETSVIN